MSGIDWQTRPRPDTVYWNGSWWTYGTGSPRTEKREPVRRPHRPLRPTKGEDDAT